MSALFHSYLCGRYAAEWLIDMNFTNDEMNLMCIYNTGSRESLMRELREMRGYIGADQPELLAMTDSTLQKLESMSDEEFAELELYPDF